MTIYKLDKQRGGSLPVYQRLLRRIQSLQLKRKNHSGGGNALIYSIIQNDKFAILQ